jgi:hypothetical protein
MLANEIGGERRLPITVALAGLNGHVAAHDVTRLRQALSKRWKKLSRRFW